MGSLTSGNWTITGANGGSVISSVVISNKQKRVPLKLTMASGEWPATGIALPGAGSVGLVRGLDTWTLNTAKLATASGYTISYVLTTGHKIRAINVPGKRVMASGSGLIPGLLATTITQASRIFYATAFGW